MSIYNFSIHLNVTIVYFVRAFSSKIRVTLIHISGKLNHTFSRFVIKRTNHHGSLDQISAEDGPKCLVKNYCASKKGSNTRV